MADLPIDQRMLDFYHGSYDEAARLRVEAHGRLEFVRTMELLRRALPRAPASLIDVGGGPGTYAKVLAGDGYRVRLIDPVPRHVAEASAHGTFTAELGDARRLEACDQSFDAALLLGPLYHLLEQDDRLQALREARRVVKPGGLVAVAAISRHAPLLDYAATRRLDSSVAERWRSIHATGRHDPSLGFTTAYMHTVAGFRDEMAAAGFDDFDVFGVEGPMWTVVDALQDALIAERFDMAVQTARLLESDPEIIPCSAHFLAVARC